jgi:hypothetical protein
VEFLVVEASGEADCYQEENYQVNRCSKDHYLALGCQVVEDFDMVTWEDSAKESSAEVLEELGNSESWATVPGWKTDHCLAAES